MNRYFDGLRLHYEIFETFNFFVTSVLRRLTGRRNIPFLLQYFRAPFLQYPGFSIILKNCIYCLQVTFLLSFIVKFVCPIFLYAMCFVL